MDDDPFHLLGVERRFDLDPSEIRLRVVRKAAKLHPDRASDPIEGESHGQELAAVHSAASILQDDERRADALLRVLGGPSASEDRTLPDGFLEEILETRMQLEEVVALGEESGILQLENWANDQRAKHVARVSVLFGKGTPSTTGDQLVKIRHELNTWRYIERMLEQLHPTEQAETDGLD